MGSGLATTRRTFLSGGLAMVALTALSACGAAQDDAQGSDDIAARPLTLSIAPPSSIDPYNACDQGSLAVAWQLFDSLTTYDFASGELSCLAAERCEMSDDASEFTFYLREATFHSGDQVTSADFKRAWERIVNPQSAAADANGASGLAYLLSLIEGYDALASGEADELAGVTCPDNQTMQILLRTPYADFPYVLAHPALGPVPASAEDDAQAFSQQPIGNGALMLASAWDGSSSSIELVRYDGYYGTPATIETATLLADLDIEEAFQSFQTGDVDIARCPIDEARTVSSSLGKSEDGRTFSRGNRFVCSTELSTSMLVCNCSEEPLNNTYLRRAISLAIDRDYLCDTLYRGTRTAADGVIPPPILGYREQAWPYATYDRAQAVDILDVINPIGEDDTRGLTVQVLYNENGGHGEVMEAIAENLEDVGIVCELEGVELEELYERVSQGDYEIARIDWTADTPVMDAVLFPLFFSGNIGATNYACYQDEQIDQTLALARTEAVAASRTELYQDVDDTVGQDCPVIPLLYHAQSFAASDRVDGLTIDPQGRIDLASAVLSEE